jgi:hypothetical protein
MMYMFPEHHVIIIPGLGNSVQQHIWATKSWKRCNVIPHIFNAQWGIEEPSFQNKLNRAIIVVDNLLAHNKTVSLIGNSAGSSFVLNIFNKRRQYIHRVIINCGRIKTGDYPWLSFKQASARSPSFRESVLLSENILSKLSISDKSKILTIRPIFDELVPPYSVQIPKARNTIIFSIEHVLSIALTMTLRKQTLIDCIREP